MNQPVASLTISEFEALIAQSYELDDEIEKFEKEVLAPRRAKAKELETKILAQLEAENKTSYKSNRGTIVRSRRYTVRVPATMEAKEQFFGWLKSKGDEVYWKYTSVNSQALNSLYKAEMEIAKEEQNVDFKIPGLGAPEMMTSLSKRSK